LFIIYVFLVFHFGYGIGNVVVPTELLNSSFVKGRLIEFYDMYNTIILPESWTRGLVKKLLNLTKRYDQINPAKIHAGKMKACAGFVKPAGPIRAL